MVWQGIQIGLTALTLLVNSPSTRSEKDSGATPAISFLPSRTDGGAILGTPFILPPELAPAALPIPKMLPLKIPTTATPAKITKTPEITKAVPLPSQGPALNLSGLWQMARQHHPQLRQVTGLDLEEKRNEVLTRLRRGYFDYLCLLQEANTIGQSAGEIEKWVHAKQPGSDVVRVSAKVQALSLEVLLEEVKAQRRKTQADLEAAWGRLAIETGVPDLPGPVSTGDRPHAPPKWTLEEVEQKVRTSSIMNRTIMEAEAARLAMLRVRTNIFTPLTLRTGTTITATGHSIPDISLTFWERKQARIREADAAYVNALASVRMQELKLLGQAREAWTRHGAAWDNLKRLNEETLPRLRSRVELVAAAYGTGEDNIGFTDLCQMERDRFKAQVEQCRTRQALWRAVADLQGLMQIGMDENWTVKK